ncbi:MAG TPA: MarR family transcriptional regulator [Pseudonocardiaceae bacterium]|nr:MarR family transcriptional regulator [Pseudonocardiaceae bacterium]
MSTTEGPEPELGSRLGYLLKHAQLRMAELNDEALAPCGIDGRELGVLFVLAGREPASQLQVAQRLGIDRTTMVALLDTLENKGLVSRHPHADDRRRNVVELTGAGQDTLRRATAASDEAEYAFLAPLSPRAAQHLRASLRLIVTGIGSQTNNRP